MTVHHPLTQNSSASGNVRVVVRVRPLSERELKRGSKEVIASLKSLEDRAIAEGCENKGNNENRDQQSELLQVQESSGSKKRWFEMDAVFDINSTQSDVYDKSGTKEAICKDIFKGFNCTILAYGQTGSGKTYTMGTDTVRQNRPEGDNQEHKCEEMDGIIPRACHDLFDAIQEKCDGNAQVELSYLEIYNEEIRDLLVDPTKDETKPLKIHETLNGEIYVSGLHSSVVDSPRRVLELMEVASKRRVVAATAMNAASSRSHAICTLYVKGIIEGSDATQKFASKMTLVDLAGSERMEKTGAEGNRVKEGININKSLSVLGRVVSALASQNRKPEKKRKHKQHSIKPPYRESKLTRLLQDSLGGNSQTIMVACVSPADFNVDESINTLRYAKNARNIKNSATRNLIQHISQEEAAKLQRENQLLKQQVQELQEMLQMIANDTDTICTDRTSVLSEDEFLDNASGFSDHGSQRSRMVKNVNFNVTELSFASDDAAIGAGHHQSERVKELEEEVQRLKKEIVTSKKNIRKSTASAIEVPALKATIISLQEELEEARELESENAKLREELEEAKQEADSCHQANTQLSTMLEHSQCTETALKAESGNSKHREELKKAMRERDYQVNTRMSTILEGGQCGQTARELEPNNGKVGEEWEEVKHEEEDDCHEASTRMSDALERAQSENSKLRVELEEARNKAKSCHQANAQMSDALERETILKRDHLKEEVWWLNFVCDALEDKSDQIKIISDDFISLLGVLSDLITGIGCDKNNNGTRSPSVTRNQFFLLSAWGNNSQQELDTNFIQRCQALLEHKAERLHKRIKRTKGDISKQSTSLRSIQESLPEDYKNLDAENTKIQAKVTEAIELS